MFKENKMKTQELFKKISMLSIMDTAFLSVLLIVPVTDSFIDHSKSYLLFFSSILVLLFFLIKILFQKSIKITVSPITNSLVIFGLVTLASTFFSSNYPVESLLGLGGIYISAMIIAIFGGSLLPKDATEKFINGMLITSSILVLATLLQMMGFGPAQLVNKILGTSLPTDMSFNIAGSSFIALQVVVAALVGAIATIISNKKVSKLYAFTLPVLVIGVGIFAWSLLPNKTTSLLLPPFTNSWSVMLDSMKNPKAALIGAGPSSYSNVYAALKPDWVNNSAQWSTVFSQATSFPLTVISTMGILGLFSWLYFVFKFVGLKKRSLLSSKPIYYMIASTILLQLLFPANTIMLTIQAVAIAFLIANEKHRLPLLQLQTLKFKILNKLEIGNDTIKSSDVPLYMTVGLGFVGIAALFYLTGRAFGANVVMAQSSKELSQNDVIKAYELQQKAVAMNPYFDVFRRRYSGTNVAIAIALSNKADISDEEKTQVSSLIQQAVREARAATTLDPIESQNWLNLAQIYKNMIGVSADAHDWSVQSYITAIETNPNDPSLRIELAQMFAAQKDYQQAISIMTQAINLKPDLAGSHYNLGLILEMVAQPDAYRDARISYQRALVLLDTNSEEYVLVNKKIEELEKMMTEKGISLEPEKDQKDQASESEQNTVPSITEQNLNQPEVGNTENQDVSIDEDSTIQNDNGASSEAQKTDLSEEL